MAENDLAGRRVLVAEDQLLQATEMEQALRDQGCIVIGPVPKMQDALKLVREEQPDAAVLNYRLADEDASELITELERRGVPFVVLTADPSIVVDAPCLMKPVPNNELIEALARALRRGS